MMRLTVILDSSAGGWIIAQVMAVLFAVPAILAYMGST